MRWTITSLVTLVIGIVVLAACEGNVHSLKVGDCYNAPTFDTEKYVDVIDVEFVNCDDPHEHEVYAVFELPDPSWKGDDYVRNQSSIGCKARFEAFVGIEYKLSTLYLNVLQPSEKTWKEEGDRIVHCSVAEGLPAMKVSGSAKDSRR